MRLRRLQRKAERHGVLLREAPDGGGYETILAEYLDEYMRTGKIMMLAEDGGRDNMGKPADRDVTRLYYSRFGTLSEVDEFLKNLQRTAREFF